jgi:hypothetical protein
MNGVLTFHSETGTEGGYWAFQDAAFISEPVKYRYCAKCGLQDRQYESTDVLTVTGSWMLTAENMAWMDKNPNEDLSILSATCDHDWRENESGSWSYEGLHILKTGDHLTILDKDGSGNVVWDGVIDLTEFTVFTDHIQNLWIHNRQKNVDMQQWAKYFFEESPARLEKKNG